MYIFYRKVVVGVFVLINLIFFFSLLGAFTSVFITAPYENLAENILEDIGFAKQLKNADGVITGVGSATGDVEDRIKDILKIQQNEDEEKFESTLYSGFVKLMSQILRIFVFIASIFSLLTCLYFRYSFAGIREATKLKHRVDELENNYKLLITNYEK